MANGPGDYYNPQANQRKRNQQETGGTIFDRPPRPPIFDPPRYSAGDYSGGIGSYPPSMNTELRPPDGGSLFPVLGTEYDVYRKYMKGGPGDYPRLPEGGGRLSRPPRNPQYGRPDVLNRAEIARLQPPTALPRNPQYGRPDVINRGIPDSLYSLLYKSGRLGDYGMDQSRVNPQGYRRG